MWPTRCRAYVAAVLFRFTPLGSVFAYHYRTLLCRVCCPPWEYCLRGTFLWCLLGTFRGAYLGLFVVPTWDFSWCLLGTFLFGANAWYFVLLPAFRVAVTVPLRGCASVLRVNDSC